MRHDAGGSLWPSLLLLITFVLPAPARAGPDAATLVRAGHLLQAGKAATALRLLRKGSAAAAAGEASVSPETEASERPSLQALRASYLEALILDRVGQRARARRLRARLEKEPLLPAGLRSLLAFEVARGLRQERAREAAIERLERIPFGSFRWFEAREAAIDLERSRGRVELACALAAELAGALRGARRENAAFFRLARCLEREARFLARRGESKAADRRLSEARGLYQAVAVLWPRNLSAVTAREAAARLGERKVRPLALEARDLLERARWITRRAHPRYGRRVLLGIRRLITEPGARAELELMLGENAFRLRRFRSSYRWLSHAERRATDEGLRARALLGIGRLRARAGRALALETYQAVARRFPETEAGLHALDLAAETARRMGKLGLARRTFEACLERAEALGAAEHARLCRWRLAWLAHREGRLEEALALAAPGTQAPPPTRAQRLLRAPSEGDPELAGRLRYWRARWLDEAGRRDASLAALRALISDQPLRLYGLLARRLLLAFGEVAPAPRLEQHADPPSSALHPAIAEAVELQALGLQRAARGAIASTVRETLDPASRRVAARLLQLSGDLPRSHRMAPLPWTGGLAAAPPVDREAARLAYPEAFAQVVKGDLRDARVAPELLWALMRVESGFDARARSTAGARGLTQLLWRTARSVARRHRKTPPRRFQLYDPEVAVALGSAYLGDLLTRFKGHLGLALAAYNAGEAAVERWRVRHRGSTFDILLEEIPYEETRRYVGRVITFYGMYQLLDGGDLGELPLDLTTPVLALR